MFLSQRPNNDPEPFEMPNTYDALTGEGNVRLSEKADGAVLAPRPEFTQTRDPKPWESVSQLGTTFRYEDGADASEGYTPKWAPRHEEFDTPVNSILEAFREDWAGYSDDTGRELDVLEYWIGWLGNTAPELHNPAIIDHARRVLSKLVAVYGG